jgi:sugar lactone lactonase YvrE
MKLNIVLIGLIFPLSFNAQIITTFAGNGIQGFAGDLGQAKHSKLWHPEGIAADSLGSIYFADETNGRIRKIVLSTGIITTVAGNGTFSYTGDDGLAKFAGFNSPEGLTFDAIGNLYIADTDNDCIRKVDAKTGIITTIAGGGTSGLRDGAPAKLAKLNNPTAVAVDKAGNIFIADWGNNRIRKVSADSGIISTIAGNGTAGNGGDQGPASAAFLNSPFGITLDGAGNLYIADAGNNCVRKITSGTGIITTLVSKLNTPTCVALGDSGNLYIADQGNNRILKVNTITEKAIVIAGKGGAGDYSGDDDLATAAELWSPTSLILDSQGNIYFTDRNNNRIRKISR